MSADELKTLIRTAAKRQRMTRYAVGKALGYKNRSAIYSIEAGRKGLSAEKLFTLMKLAGKSFLFVILTSIGMTNTTITEAQAQVQPAVNTSIHYAKWLYGRMQASWTRFWLTSVFA